MGAPFGDRGRQRRDHVAHQGLVVLGLLQHRVEPRDPFGARLVAPQHVADAGREPATGAAMADDAARHRRIAERIARHGSVTRALHESGVIDYTRARSVVSARMPTQEEADALARATMQPVLVVQYVNVDKDGTPVEAGTTLFAADAVQLVVEPEQME